MGRPPAPRLTHEVVEEDEEGSSSDDDSQQDRHQRQMQARKAKPKTEGLLPNPKPLTGFDI